MTISKKEDREKAETLSFTVPREIKMKLGAISKSGYYDSLSEFLRDAIRSILEQKKDLRIALAYELYKSKRVSLGKAAEIIETTPAEALEFFKERELS